MEQSSKIAWDQKILEVSSIEPLTLSTVATVDLLCHAYFLADTVEESNILNRAITATRPEIKKCTNSGLISSTKNHKTHFLHEMVCLHRVMLKLSDPIFRKEYGHAALESAVDCTVKAQKCYPGVQKLQLLVKLLAVPVNELEALECTQLIKEVALDIYTLGDNEPAKKKRRLDRNF